MDSFATLSKPLELQMEFVSVTEIQPAADVTKSKGAVLLACSKRKGRAPEERPASKTNSGVSMMDFIYSVKLFRPP